MIEDAVRKAIIAELQRQASERPEDLHVVDGRITVTIEGSVDIDELVMAVLGAVAGGP